MAQIVSDVTSVLDYKNSKKTAETERQKLLSEMAEDERTKTNLVNKALATQRAKYGASGMSSRGVTEGAVLKRIKSETAEPYEKRCKTNMEKLSQIKTTKPNLLKSLLSRFDDLLD